MRIVKMKIHHRYSFMRRTTFPCPIPFFGLIIVGYLF